MILPFIIRGASERGERRRKFARLMAAISDAESAAQAEAGRSVNLAKLLFVQRFGGVAYFRSLTLGEHLLYLGALADAHERIAVDNPRAAIGLILFMLWIRALLDSDPHCMQECTDGLMYLSSKDVLGPRHARAMVARAGGRQLQYKRLKTQPMARCAPIHLIPTGFSVETSTGARFNAADAVGFFTPTELSQYDTPLFERAV